MFRSSPYPPLLRFSPGAVVQLLALHTILCFAGARLLHSLSYPQALYLSMSIHEHSCYPHFGIFLLLLFSSSSSLIYLLIFILGYLCIYLFTTLICLIVSRISGLWRRYSFCPHENFMPAVFNSFNARTFS